VLCFTPYGRITTTYNAGTPPDCTTVTGNIVGNQVVYTVTPAAAFASAHPLEVTVSTSGEIRMCDPAKSLAAGFPDGC
jgi:type IV fimbrial biogenesis protein FimT